MEKKFYTDDFEQLLKEKSDQFRMYPSKRVWHSIYNDLHPGRKWPSVAMSMLLIIALLLIGYLNTGDNTVSRQFAVNAEDQQGNGEIAKNTPKNVRNRAAGNGTGTDQQSPGAESENPGNGSLISETEITDNLFAKNITPDLFGISDNGTSEKDIMVNVPAGNNNLAGTNGTGHDNNNISIIDKVDNYIKNNQIFNDVAASKKKRAKDGTAPANRKASVALQGMDEEEGSAGETSAGVKKNGSSSAVPGNQGNDQQINGSANLPANDAKSIAALADEKADHKEKPSTAKTGLTAEEKAWIENYALHNKPSRNRWKGRLGVSIYATPAMDYRTVSMEASKGSVTPFVNTNINNSIDHKPGLGIEAGLGLDYSLTKRIRLKAGAQFNFTNYGISADETNHPIVSLLLMQDAATGLSYVSTRTATLANPANGSALKPVTVHNTTYQVSIPLGVAFKLASNSRLGWYAGATIQPTYIFGGKAYIVSADMKDYVSEPSAIRNWNLNTGIETYIHYKIGGFTLQVGPQARYQLFSSYSRKYALVEKPYAMGLKFGLVKGF